MLEIKKKQHEEVSTFLGLRYPTGTKTTAAAAIKHYDNDNGLDRHKLSKTDEGLRSKQQRILNFYGTFC